MRDPAHGEDQAVFPILLAAPSLDYAFLSGLQASESFGPLLDAYWQEFALCIATSKVNDPQRGLMIDRWIQSRDLSVDDSAVSHQDKSWFLLPNEYYLRASRLVFLSAIMGRRSGVLFPTQRNLQRDVCGFLCSGAFVSACRSLTVAVLRDETTAISQRNDAPFFESAIDYLSSQVATVDNFSIKWEIALLVAARDLTIAR